MDHCVACNQSSSSVKNFLLKCASCKEGYHHRHHKPPVSDRELITRIQAKDPKDGLAAWRCVNCSRHQAPKRTDPNLKKQKYRTNDEDVIEISPGDEEGRKPLARPSASVARKKTPEVISLDSSDDEAQKMHHKRPSITAASHELLIQEQPQPQVAADHVAPKTYLPPPWLDHRPPNLQGDIWDEYRKSRNTRIRSPTSLTYTQSRKTPISRHTPLASYTFDISSWRLAHK